MNEEEIEKQADKYLIKFWCKNNTVDILPIKTAWDLRCLLIDVIKYVLSEGRKDAIEWHDLRKDPNDLPKGNEICSAPVYVVSKHGNSDLAQYDYSQKLWCYKHSNEHILYEVIAWCEQPQFKESEE